MKKYKRVAAYVNLDAIEENFEAMKANLQAGTQIAAVVKANGYGHGAVPIAQMIEEELGKKETEVQYAGKGSQMFFGKVRQEA